MQVGTSIYIVHMLFVNHKYRMSDACKTKKPYWGMILFSVLAAFFPLDKHFHWNISHWALANLKRFDALTNYVIFFSIFALFIHFMSTCVEFIFNLGPSYPHQCPCYKQRPAVGKSPLNLNACAKFHMVFLFGWRVSVGIRSSKDLGRPGWEWQGFGTERVIMFQCHQYL